MVNIPLRIFRAIWMKIWFCINIHWGLLVHLYMTCEHRQNAIQYLYLHLFTTKFVAVLLTLTQKCHISQISNVQKVRHLNSRCRIEFWPHWISTRGVLIQRAALRIQRIFHVELRPLETGGHCITTPPTDKIKTPRWIVTPGLYSTLNYDPRS